MKLRQIVKQSFNITMPKMILSLIFGIFAKDYYLFYITHSDYLRIYSSFISEFIYYLFEIPANIYNKIFDFGDKFYHPSGAIFAFFFYFILVYFVLSCLSMIKALVKKKYNKIV